MALIDTEALLEAVQTEKARRAAGHEHMVTTVEMINIIDTLGTAKTRCAALMMAAEALAERAERDAVSWLAEDADHIINLAIDALEALRTEVQS